MISSHPKHGPHRKIVRAPGVLNFILCFLYYVTSDRSSSNLIKINILWVFYCTTADFWLSVWVWSIKASGRLIRRKSQPKRNFPIDFPNRHLSLDVNKFLGKKRSERIFNFLAGVLWCLRWTVNFIKGMLNMV